MNTPIFVHVTNNNILECKIIIKSLKIIDPRKDIPLFLDLLPYIIFFYHDSNYTEHNKTKMHQSFCEENHCSFRKNCILILYNVLLCTSTFKLTPAKYLHVLGLHNQYFGNVLVLHGDSRQYLRPVVQCHTLVELVWLLEASLDVMLDIYPVLHFVPPLFILHYAKFSLERTYNILYILNQHIVSVREFFVFNFDEISFSEQAYLLCFPKSYILFTLYSSNVHKLKQCVLEQILREPYFFGWPMLI